MDKDIEIAKARGDKAVANPEAHLGQDVLEWLAREHPELADTCAECGARLGLRQQCPICGTWQEALVPPSFDQGSDRDSRRAEDASL